jgi:hypothetical protein
MEEFLGALIEFSNIIGPSFNDRNPVNQSEDPITSLLILEHNDTANDRYGECGQYQRRSVESNHPEETNRYYT